MREGRRERRLAQTWKCIAFTGRVSLGFGMPYRDALYVSVGSQMPQLPGEREIGMYLFLVTETLSGVPEEF